MVTVSNISIQYGGKFLFNNISFALTKKDRIGLVGKNGAGKSTLLKILIKEILPESGTIAMDNNTTLGYLPQDMSVKHNKTVYEEAAMAFAKVKELEATLNELNIEIAERTDYESKAYTKLLNRLNDAQDQFERLGGMSLREDIEKILKGLGFLNGDFDRPLSEFSGGWQMRVELAKILLQKPTYVLLDEPTNHLDIESIMWLESFLDTYPGGVILISHDRAFLDAVTNRTIELVNSKLYDYRTSYSKFVELREERRSKQIIEAKRQEKYVEETEKLINKFRAKKNKAKFAQTLITKLDRLEKVEIDDQEKGSINFRFPDAPRSGKVVVTIEQLDKSYGRHEVLRNVDFTLERGEKIAFVGKNGEGKTTLSKIIRGIEPHNAGKCELGYNVAIGYYEQHQAESLDGNQTVFQVIDDAATGDMRLKVRSLLGAFLFSGEDVDKKVQVLSGGEKSRLALAKMLLNPVNLLILDEPTNHLDMRAKEILKKALLDFTGSLIIVSHDREFLKGLTSKVYEFRNKGIKPYYGDVYNFLEERNLQNLNELNLKGKMTTTKSKANLSKQERIAQRNQLKDLDKAIKRQSNKVSKSERTIQSLENSIEECEKTMGASDFYTKNPNPEEVMAKYATAKEDLETEMENWEMLTLELEELKEKREQMEG